MGLYLIDTSAWILHFSRSEDFDLRRICAPEERLLCLPVYQEILQGIKDETVFRAVRDILGSAEFVENPLRLSLYDEAVNLYRMARMQGLTIRSSVDCLIAACAIRHDLTLVHHDRDYESLSRISGLRQLRV